MDIWKCPIDKKAQNKCPIYSKQLEVDLYDVKHWWNYPPSVTSFDVEHFVTN